MPGARSANRVGRMNPYRHLIATCAAVVLCLAFAGTASADSLVFIKDNNLWTSKGDGSQARALTGDGDSATPYRSPSQADNGTILAQRETALGLWNRNGTYQRAWKAATGSNGPWDPVISPDGTKWAHWVFVEGGYSDPSTGIYFSRLGSPTVWGDIATGKTTGFTSTFNRPAWLQDSARALVFDDGAYMSPSVYVAPVNEWTEKVQGWFRDSDTGDGSEYFDIAAGDISAQGTHLAAVRATGYPGDNVMPTSPGNQLTLYNVNGFGSPPVKLPCSIKDPDGSSIDKASFSPDGNRLVFSTKAATYTTAFDGTCGSVAPRKILDGATSAFWGPSDHPAAPARRPARPVGCKAKRGKARIACSYKAAVAKCKTIKTRTRKGKRKRARCIKAAKRTRAVATCRVKPARTKKAKRAQKRCVRAAKRRYR